MSQDPDNPFAAPADDTPQPPAAPIKRRSKFRIVFSTVLMVAGILVGLLGLALISNRFGNTDMYGGEFVVGIGGFLFGTGFSRLFMRLPLAILVGCLVGPLSIVLLFVLFWLSIFLFIAVTLTQ